MYIGRNKDERPMDGCYLRRWNRNTLAVRQLLTNDGPSGLCPPPFTPQPTPLPPQTPRESIVNHPRSARHNWPMIKRGKRNCEPNMRVYPTWIDITLQGSRVTTDEPNKLDRNIDANWLYWETFTGKLKKKDNIILSKEDKTFRYHQVKWFVMNKADVQMRWPFVKN